MAEDNVSMVRILTLTLLSACAFASPAAAHDSGSWEHKNKYLRSKMSALGGNPGCNLVAHKCKRLKVTGDRVRRYFNVMRRAIMPRSAANQGNYGRPRLAPAGTESFNVGPHLAAIAACESGGNPGAIGGGGAFRGKYQFTFSTWASVGGVGDPAAASEAEQDKRAAILYAREGAGPWPECGR